MRSDHADHAVGNLRDPVWPPGTTSALALVGRGLVLGAGTCLVRVAGGDRLALDEDRERLLSVAAERPVLAGILEPIAAAAGYWQRGDKALANLRLVFAGLPRLASAVAVENLRDAADLIDGGLPPRDLMKALGFDTAALDKFNPGQPRVPAGSSPTSGQGTGSAGGRRGRRAARHGRRPSDGHAGDDRNAYAPRASNSGSIIPVADDGPLRPGGFNIIPHPGVVDLLDSN